MSDRPSRLAPASHVAAILLTRDSGGAFAAARCLAAATMPFDLVATDACAAVRTLRGCAGTTRVSRAAFDDPAGVLRDVLCALLEAHPRAVIVPSGMAATAHLAGLAPSLPPRQVFPLSPVGLVRELDDKWSFTARLERLGVSYPTSRLIAAPTDVANLDLAFPAVIKPLESEGSRGLQWVDTSAGLGDAVQRIAAAGLLPIMVQQHIEGSDLAVSGLAERGTIRAFLAHSPLGDGSFDYAQAPDAVEVARTVISATGFHGVFNMDFRREAATDKLFVLEVNPRLYASVHKDAYAGVNLVELGIRLARGEDFTAPAVGAQLILDMPARVRRLATAKGRAELSPGSRAAIRADLHDPVSTVVEGFEQRYRRARGGRRRPWQKLDNERRGWRRQPAR